MADHNAGVKQLCTSVGGVQVHWSGIHDGGVQEPECKFGLLPESQGISKIAVRPELFFSRKIGAGISF